MRHFLYICQYLSDSTIKNLKQGSKIQIRMTLGSHLDFVFRYGWYDTDMAISEDSRQPGKPQAKDVDVFRTFLSSLAFP